MIIIISIVIGACVIWLFLPIAYMLYTNTYATFNPLVPQESRQTWEMTTDMWYNLVRFSGLIVLGATAYYLWTVAQRKKAEDIV